MIFLHFNPVYLRPTQFVAVVFLMDSLYGKNKNSTVLTQLA